MRRNSPQVQLGRPILTQLVTRLFNAEEAGIPFDINEVVEQTLVVRARIPVCTTPHCVVSYMFTRHGCSSGVASVHSQIVQPCC